MAELPRDVIALDWGYEADHPFDVECRALCRVGRAVLRLPGHFDLVQPGRAHR